MKSMEERLSGAEQTLYSHERLLDDAFDKIGQTWGEVLGVRSDLNELSEEVEAIQETQDAHDSIISNIIDQLGVFLDGQWCNSFLWSNDAPWKNGCGCMTSTSPDIIEEYETKINSLEQITAQLIGCCRQQQSQIAAMQEQINKLTQIVAPDDMWHNDLFWCNENLWPGVFVTAGGDVVESQYIDHYDAQSESIFFKDSPSAVVSHDAETETFSILTDNPLIKAYSEISETITM